MAFEELCMSCYKIKGEYSICPFCGWADDSLPEQAYHLHPRTVLQNRYIVGIVIGFGGFGVTYKCWDINLGKVVAVKEFYPAGLVNRIPGEKQVVVFSGDKKEQYRLHLERFLEEARTMAKFDNHPNIVNVYNFFLENETGYIAMEYLEGQTLKEYLDTCGGKLDLDNALEITNPVMEALIAMHQKGVIHRDIHPSNIYLNNDGYVKLLDLGAARLSTGDKEETRSVVITPGYASPEQYRSKSKQGPFTDVYGLGAVLYKLVTGVVPEESVDRQVDDQLKKASSINPLVKGNLDKAIMKALSVKPELRFQTIEAFRDALFKNKAVKYPEEELKSRIRRRIIITALSAAVFVGLIAMSFFMSRPMFSYTPDEITVVFISDDEGYDLSEVYSELTQQYMEEFKDLTINFEVVEAANENVDPSLYKDAELIFSSRFDFPDGFAIPIKPFYDKAINEDYLFLKEYISKNPETTRLPLGFSASCLFENTIAARGINPSLIKIADADCFDMNSLGKDGYMIGKNGYTSILLALKTLSGEEKLSYDFLNQSDILFPKLVFDEAREGRILTPMDIFAEDESPYYLGDTSDFREVQSCLPGYYAVYPLFDGTAVTGTFAQSAVINANATENQKNAAMTFLLFMLRNSSQNYLHVQNDCAIPLNKETFDAFITANYELGFLKPLAENNVILVAGDEDLDIIRFSKDFYNNIITNCTDFNDSFETYNDYLKNYRY